MDLSNPQHWQGYAYAANNPITSSDPTGLRPVADDGYHWSQKYTPDHEQAVQMWANLIRQKYSSTQRQLDEGTGKMRTVRFVPSVTTDRTTNSIPGSSGGKNPNNNGYADIVCWDCEENAILVWEVKHEATTPGATAERQGPRQLERYRRALERARPDKIVLAGPDFEDELTGVSPVTGGPIYVHSSKLEPNQGVVVYRSEPDKERVSAENKANLDYGAVQEDPVSDAIMMGVIVVGVVAVGMCILSVGCLVVGGAVVTTQVMTKSQLGLAA